MLSMSGRDYKLQQLPHNHLLFANFRLTGTVGLKKEKENANVALPRINVVKIKKTLPLLPDSTNAVVSLFFATFFQLHLDGKTTVVFNSKIPL